MRARGVKFEDRLTLVEHLDELRTRIIVSLLVVGVALGLCFWQNHLLLELANGPLPAGKEPITLGVGEPFITTLTLAVYGALLLSFPVILYQACAFVLPALTPNERRAVLPLLLMVPVLFAAGVVFSYFVVMPAAVEFLLGFNADEFNIEVRAREYYGFVGLSLFALGILFQIPVAVMAATRIGLVTPDQLASNRRYALLVVAIVAMLLPGQDPVTMVIAMGPLWLLFELSILMSRVFGRRSAATVEADSPAEQPR